jgi:DNA-binding transcriptional LysR family regulator
MTLKQLQAFYWAAKLGSFGLGAERLHTTQSSLSKRIAELESDLDERLFDRSGPRARITEAGQRLFELAAKMLELEDDIRASVPAANALRGVCKFGVGEFVVHTWLPAFAARVRRDHPGVVLEPYIGLAKNLMVKVARGDLDFAIMPAPSTNAAVEAVPVREVELVWVAAPSLVGASTGLTREMLEQHPMIAMTPESGVTMALDLWAVTHGLKFQRIISTSSMSAAAALAVAGLGLSLLAAGFARPLIERGQLVELRCEDPMPAPPRIDYFLHSRKEDTRWLLRAIKPIVLLEANFEQRSILLP